MPMNLLAKRGGFRHHVRMVTPAFSDCINKLGVDEKDVIPFGRNKAKISLDVLDNLPWDRCSAARAELPEAAKAP